MSNRVVHKESLPGQGHIKRRRGLITPLGDGDEGDAPHKAATEKTQDDGREDSVKKQRQEPLAADGTQVPSKATSVSGSGGDNSPTTSSSSSSEDDEDEDEDALARETARLAQLRARAAAAGAKAPDATSTTASSGNTPATGSYTHDVLFRRQEWRKANANTAATADALDKEKKWRLVVNNKEESTNFQTFMKKHFK